MALNKLLTITLLCITCTALRILPAAAFSSISTPRTAHKARISGLLMSADVESETTIADIEEITTFASKNGVDLKFTTNAARGYRGVAVSKNDPENILGYIEGFIRPAGKVLHADKMEIFKSALFSARRENDSFTGGGTYLGPGLLIAFVCLLHGIENGCQTIEFLAIDDAEFQHKRLIRYYKTAGFEEVRYVGEELKDIPDRLVWGGCGTLMMNDIEQVLQKWTRIIRGANRRMERENNE